MRYLSVMLTDQAAGLKSRQAIGVLELAVQIDPENHMALIDLATVHYSAKRYAEALPLLELANRYPDASELEGMLADRLDRGQRREGDEGHDRDPTMRVTDPLEVEQGQPERTGEREPSAQRPRRVVLVGDEEPILGQWSGSSYRLRNQRSSEWLRVSSTP